MNLKDIRYQAHMIEYLSILGDVGRAHLAANYESRMDGWENTDQARIRIFQSSLTMESLDSELKVRSELVGRLQALDAIAAGDIPNSKFAWNNVYLRC